MRNDVIDKGDHKVAVGCLDIEDIPSEVVSNLLKQYEAYIIVFDWSSMESLLELQDWIDFAKGLRYDPPIFLIGCKLDQIPQGREDEFKGVVEKIKVKHLIFNHINAKFKTDALLEREVKLMMTVIVQDCKTAISVARRKSIYNPTSDPNWGFVLVD